MKADCSTYTGAVLHIPVLFYCEEEWCALTFVAMIFDNDSAKLNALTGARQYPIMRCERENVKAYFEAQKVSSIRRE